ncbi:hypothetical protein [Pectinatus sottacetonis]|uniref:hypothetical protein n=1 Tax=Pectinatus sottacetonis TaxID=1002795 RepID=UPI0018C72FDE|nr:hypothetical protein [Pectinatus sottacetonis]
MINILSARKNDNYGKSIDGKRSHVMGYADIQIDHLIIYDISIVKYSDTLYRVYSNRKINIVFDAEIENQIVKDVLEVIKDEDNES